MPPSIDPSKPRPIYTFDDSASGIAPLTDAEINDVRILTGARVVHAFTIARVAGGVCQSNIFDYRLREGEGEGVEKEKVHFGVPLSSVEIKLVDGGGRKNSDEEAVGVLVVSGPAVEGIDGSVKVDRVMRITAEQTLGLA